MSEETTVIEPLWADWAPPEKPSDALKLGLEYARMEGLWCQCTLLRLRSEEADEEDYTLREKLAKEGLTCGNVSACAIGILIMSVLDGPVVTAYLVPNLRPPVRPRGKSWDAESMLVSHRVGGPATVFLSAGLAKVASILKAKAAIGDVNIHDVEIAAWDEPEEIINHYLNPNPGGLKPTKQFPNVLDRQRQSLARDAKGGVIQLNDAFGHEITFARESGLKSHELILRGFEEGHKFALEHEAKLGFV